MYSTITLKLSNNENIKDNIPPSKGTASALSIQNTYLAYLTFS